MNMRKKVTVGGTRVHRTMAVENDQGELVEVPCYEGFSLVSWSVSGQEIITGRRNAIVARATGKTKDICDTCAISLAGKRQMKTPFCRVGAEHTYVCEPVIGMPQEKGVDVLGDGRRWIVRAYEATAVSKRIVDLNDTDVVSESQIDPDEMHTVVFQPRKPSDLPENKAKRNARNPKRIPKGDFVKPNPKGERLLEDGRRNYSGRVWV